MIDIEKIRNSDKPNVLMLTVDQMRFDCLNSALREDDRFMVTPNLDRLAREGVTFTNCYSMNPVCVPARHNIITGLTAKHHGFDDNYFDIQKNIPYNLPTIGQIMSDSGFDTIAIGKLHFQPALRHNGFNRLLDMDEIPRWREDDSYAMYLKNNGLGNIQSIHGVRHLLYMQPQRSLIPEKHHSNKWVADRTIDYLDENRGRRPFFIWSNWISPHPPFDVIDRLADLYKGKTLFPSYDSKTPISNLARENINIADYPNENVLQRAKELYCSQITHVDENIGRILDKLEQINQLDNTIIFFMSDHGEMFGSNSTYQKFLPYDASSKVPFIVRYPKLFAENSIETKFVTLNDLMPTLLDIIQKKYPAHYELPGISLLNSSQRHEEIYIEHSKGNRRWISLRKSEYKYNYYFGGGYQELFNLETDPLERENLLHAPTHGVKRIAAGMKSRLTELEEKFGLPGMVKNGKLVELEVMPIHFYRETNFPYIYDRIIDDEEKKSMNNMVDEIISATEKENLVVFSELDLDTWRKAGGFSSKDVKKLLDVDKQRKEKMHPEVAR